MPIRHVRWFVLAVLLVASTTALCDQVIYKWKDAAGSVHYSDTPPPPGATLIKGPKPARSAAQDDADKPMMQLKCRPDISAADCDAARRSLQHDVDDLERTARQPNSAETAATSKADMDKELADIRAKNCSESRTVLAVLQKRERGEGSDRLTAEDIAAIPGQIKDAEARIAHFCD